MSPLLGEEEAEALLSQFPARDLDEPLTKEFVRAEISELELRLGSRFDDKLTAQTRWTVGTIVGVGAAVIGAVGLWA